MEKEGSLDTSRIGWQLHASKDCVNIPQWLFDSGGEVMSKSVKTWAIKGKSGKILQYHICQSRGVLKETLAYKLGCKIVRVEIKEVLK